MSAHGKRARKKKKDYTEKKPNCVQGGILVTPDKPAHGFAAVFWDTMADMIGGPTVEAPRRPAEYCKAGHKALESIGLFFLGPL